MSLFSVTTQRSSKNKKGGCNDFWMLKLVGDMLNDNSSRNKK